MYIEDEKWKNLKVKFKELYRCYDFFGDNARSMIDDIDICIDDIEENKSNKIYVVTNNAIVDDQIYYQIAGVSITKDGAEKIFKNAIRKTKDDIDFENLDAIEINEEENLDQEEWFYEETDTSFELYLNGEYNSNNFSINIEEFDLCNTKNKELGVDI